MGYGEIKNRSEFTAALDKTEDSKNIVIVDCFTTWCKICKAIAPKIDELNRKYGEDKNVLWCVDRKDHTMSMLMLPSGTRWISRRQRT